MEFHEIEQKWQKKWADARIFEPDVSEVRKFFITAAFPYPNSPQHIGHARTYTTTDVYARFMRMKGYNVLFPMAFHVTGTPVLAMAKRIAEGDKEIYEVFKNIYNIPEHIISQLNTPEKLVDYFSREIELGMKEMGFSIDWRRKFYTYDKMFNRFIEWQFMKLNEKGYLTKGSHPVPWCPKDNNAVGSHDTQGDVDPNIDEYALIKFKFGNYYLLTATFRPETIYGVTNLWVNPAVSYSRIESNGESYIVSSDAAEKLKHQMKLEVKEQVKAVDLIGRTCRNPMTGEEIPILPADFVDPRNGSGVVMSVPAHAPYDFLALRDLKGTSYESYSDSIIQVIELSGYGKYPAKEICEKLEVASQKDPKAEQATEELYRAEAHGGKMILGRYKGERTLIAKDKIKQDMLSEGKALVMYDIINGPVYCRCGALCVVKRVEAQWFINYGDELWKEQVKECLKQVRIIPEKTVVEYEYTIDWLKEKACVRASGLGTPFPFDKTQIIESLSDSTIYMAFYTLSHYLKDIDAEKLKPEFFDYVLLGKGDVKPLSFALGIDEQLLNRMREEFIYWYPLDSRHSAGDLVHNHLTFFLFNHVAIFPKELWPKQIATNGFVLMEGKKMSKSMGNILPLRDAIRKYGTDVVRFSVVSGADLSQDADFNPTMAEGIASRMGSIAMLVERCNEFPAESNTVDKWLLSTMHRKIKNSEELYSKLELRDISQEALYSSVNDLRRYLRRGGKNRKVLREYLEYLTLLLAPFMPHFAEEMWEKLGKKEFVKNSEFVSIAEWPKHDENKLDNTAELSEELISETREDIDNIIKITKVIPRSIYLYCASDWKRKLYTMAYKEKKFDVVMKQAMNDDRMRASPDETQRVLQQLIKNVNHLSPLVLTLRQEMEALENAKSFLAFELNADIFVLPEEKAGEAHAKKARQATPMKPSIFFE
jgi:leucyl-tRNA synthetase